MWWDKLEFHNDGLVLFEGKCIPDDMVDLLLLWKKVGEELIPYLNLPISNHEMLCAAAVICNPYDGVGEKRSSLSHKYGTNSPGKAIQILRDARKQLTKIQIHEGRGGRSNPVAIEEVRQSIKEAAGMLWHDVRLRVQFGERDEIKDIIDLLITYYDAYLNELGGNARKRHPYIVALALRAVFERYSTRKITSGHGANGGVRVNGTKFKERPSGAFAKCLKKVYSATGIDANARYYASEARNCASDDDFLDGIQIALSGASDRMREFQSFFE